jgi:multidrug efflux system membrane fusion protein
MSYPDSNAASTGRRAVAVVARGALAVVLAAALTAGSCSKRDEGQDKSTGRGDRVVSVSVSPAVPRDVPVEIATFGSVRPFCTVEVTPQVGGTLTAVHIRKGQLVRKGDLLFNLDPRPFEAALAVAQANLDRDRVREANARRDAQREAELLQKGIAAPSEYDKLLADADALAAAIKADEADVEKSRLELEHASISSPADGRAGDLPVDVGNVVKANEMTLVTINQVQPVEVFFSVPQADLTAVRRSLAGEGKLVVRAWLPEDPGDVETGELTFVNNQIDPSSGTIALAGMFANVRERLWPGQYVRVSLVLAVLPGALTVPAQAVQTGREGKYVFVVDADGTAAMRPVKVGQACGPDVVIAEGLSAGQQVVTDGQFQLTPGARVAIRPAATASAPAADAPAGDALSPGTSPSAPAEAKP